MWVAMFLSLLTSVIYQISQTGWTKVTLLIVIPALIALVKVIYDNSSPVRIHFRRFKNFLNLSTFDMDTSAVFKINRDSRITNINRDYIKIQDILYNLLLENGYNGTKAQLVDPSFDKISGVRFYVVPHKMYFSISQTDNYGEESITIESSVTLKYKKANDIIDSFLISFYQHLNDDLLIKEQKYIVKVARNTKRKDFMIKHFLREINSERVQNFVINVKEKPSINLSINQKQVVLVTSKREKLVQSIKYSVDLIN